MKKRGLVTNRSPRSKDSGPASERCGMGSAGGVFTAYCIYSVLIVCGVSSVFSANSEQSVHRKDGARSAHGGNSVYRKESTRSVNSVENERTEESVRRANLRKKNPKMVYSENSGLNTFSVCALYCARSVLPLPHSAASSNGAFVFRL